MITSEIKDDVLSKFIAAGMSCTVDIKTDCKAFQLNSLEYEAVIDQFKKMDLIRTEMEALGGIRLIRLTADAHDLYNRGGFVAQDEILKANISKLGFELEKLSQDLEPKFAERAQTLSAIAANIATALSLFRF